MAMGAAAPDPAPPEVDAPRAPRLRVAPSTIVLFGVVFWIIPLLGLMPPPDRDRPGRPVVMVLAHVVYGLTLGAVVGRREA